MKASPMIISFLAALGICTSLGMSSSQAQARFSYMYTLMINVVGPAANAVWERSASDTLREEDWRLLKLDSQRLAASADQIAFGGTSETEEQRAKSDTWQNWARAFREATSVLEQAVDQRDKTRVVSASDRLVEACEGCHMTFSGSVR